LDTGPAGILQANNRRALFHGHFLHFADFLGMGLRERSAKDRKVLRKHKSLAAINGAPDLQINAEPSA